MSGRQSAGKNDVRFARVRNYFGDPEKADAYKNKPIKMGDAASIIKGQRCVQCGVSLAFGRTNDGRIVKLDIESPVYAVVYEKSDSYDGNVIVRTHMAFVDHEYTCKEGKKEL